MLVRRGSHAHLVVSKRHIPIDQDVTVFACLVKQALDEALVNEVILTDGFESAAPGLEDRCPFSRARAEGQSLIPGLSRRRPRVRARLLEARDQRRQILARIEPTPQEP